MPDNVAASMTASIVLDKSDLLAQILKGLSEGQKELQNNKLEMYFDFSNSKNQAEFEKVIQKYRKQLSSQEFVVTIKDQGIDETVKSLDKLVEVVKSLASGKAFGTGSGNGKGIGNSIVDERQLKTVINLFEKMESHLGSMRKVISDVGDGDEFSPLLTMINKVDSSISELAKKTSSLSLNMNLDFGSDDKMTAEVQSRTAKLLHTYENLFNRPKMSGTLDSNMQGYFDNFDINQYDNMNAKIAAYKNFITEMREMSKQQFGKDYLYSDIEKSYYSAVSGAQRSLNNIIKSESTSNNSIENLFGKTDLSEVISQLTIIVNKLDEISASANNFTNVFKNGLDVNTSIQEVIDLTNRVKELETELAKIKNATPATVSSTGESNISSGMKDAFPSTDTKLDEAVASAKDLDKTLEQVDIPTDSFDKVLEKLDRTKSELVDIVKITKQSVSDAEGKFHDSYTLKDSRGSTEIYGMNSKTDKGQILRQNIVGYDVKKDVESVNKVNSAIQKTDEILDTLPLHDKLDSQFLDMIDSVDNLNSKLKSGELTLSEYKNEVKSVTSEYSKMVSIQQKRDVEEYNANAKADNAKKLEREKQIWNELTTSLDRYATLQKRIASNNALSTDNEEATTLLEHIHELQRNDILPTEKLTASNEKLQQINQTVTDLKAKLKESTLDSLQGSIDKYQKIYNQRRTYSSDFIPSEQYTKNLTDLNTAIEKLVAYRNTLKNVSEVTVEQETHLKGLVTACEKASDSFKSLSASEKGANQIAVDKLVQRINKDLDECTNYSKEAKLGLRALRDELESANPRNLKEITSEIINIENAEIRAGRAGRSFFDTLKNSGFHQFAAQMAGMFGFYDVINLGKEGFNVVRELNTALTEMRKVSNETVQSLESYQDTTFDTADAIGTTAKQLQNSTADWMRLGESMDQAAESAKDANVLLNVSEFDNIDEATESLVSMSQAYKDLDKMDIINVLNNIGNNYSISTDGLATALKDSASALVTANNDLNEAVALTTSGNAITQDPSKVGAGLRTISLRLVGTEAAKQELSDLGEETDGMITTVSKLRDIIKSATAAATADGQGFDILDSNGNYKSTYEIMQGLADLYDDIVKKDKELGTNNLNLLLETIAGEFLPEICGNTFYRTHLIALIA